MRTADLRCRGVTKNSDTDGIEGPCEDAAEAVGGVELLGSGRLESGKRASTPTKAWSLSESSGNERFLPIDVATGISSKGGVGSQRLLVPESRLGCSGMSV